MINLGTNVMKLGHNKKAALEMRNQTKEPIRMFREWQIGVVFFILGNIANFISFGFAAQSLLAALGSVQFVSNVAFASIVLKEKITYTIIGATGCIVAGCVMLVLFGSHSSKQFTVEEMMDLYSNPGYIAYLISLSIFVVLLYSIYKCGKRKMIMVGFSGLTHYWYRLLPVSYAVFSGMIGTQSVLFGKTLSTLLRVTFGGNSQLDSWFTWIIIVFFLFASTFWITRLNKALKYFPAMIIVPTMQISWTFFSIVSGMLYFQEYRDLDVKQGIMYTFAVIVIFFGVYLLTKMHAIECEISTRLSESLADEKDRSSNASISRHTPQSGGVETLKAKSISWEDDTDLENMHTPIVSTPASDLQDLTVQGSQNHHQPVSTLSTSVKVIMEEDDEEEEQEKSINKKCVVFADIMDDLSIDICSSFKGTVGLGSETAPGVTVFGPPVVWSNSSPLTASNLTEQSTASAPAAAAAAVGVGEDVGVKKDETTSTTD
eukprot:g3474.t1